MSDHSFNFNDLLSWIRRQWRNLIENGPVYLRRVRRYVQHWFWQFLSRPAFHAGVVVLLMAVLATVLLFFVERYSATDEHGNLLGRDGPYGTWPKTIHNVTVFLLSGYDANDPETEIGFALAIFCLFLGFCILALLTGDLASWLLTAAQLARRRHRVRAKDHIVICGWHHTAQALVQQLISRERKPHREIAVVDKDTDEIEVYDPDVHHVRGDPTEGDVLERANTHRAHTAIVPIDWKLSEAEQDSRTALAAMAVKAKNEHIYTCVEILEPHHRRHIERIGVEETVCVGDFSRKLIASAVVANGLSHLMADILTFNQGSEIYRVSLPAKLAGRTFRWLLKALNEQHGGILLCVQRDQRTLTNPQQELTLEDGDELFVLSEQYPERLDELADA